MLIKEKIHTIISVDAEKIQQLFVIKTLNKLGLEGSYLNLIKIIHEKHLVNIILNGERLDGFLLTSETRMYALKALLFNIELEILLGQLGKKTITTKVDAMSWCTE